MAAAPDEAYRAGEEEGNSGPNETSGTIARTVDGWTAGEPDAEQPGQPGQGRCRSSAKKLIDSFRSYNRQQVATTAPGPVASMAQQGLGISPPPLPPPLGR